jgi:hypothetical protein
VGGQAIRTWPHGIAIEPETDDKLVDSIARRLAYHRSKFDSITKDLIANHDVTIRNAVFERMAEIIKKMEEKS